MLFENLSRKQIIYFIIFHLILGALTYSVKAVASIWFWSVFMVVMVNIFNNKNRNGVIGLYIAYMVGMEVFCRMMKAAVPWEGVKYFSSFFSILGIILESRKREKPTLILVYFLLLMPSLIMVDYDSFESARNEISFSISGPISVLFCTYYYFKKEYSLKQIGSILFVLILPMLTTCVIIFLKAPNIQNIAFNDAANASLSGGFGPNQVASLLGLGVMVMIVAYYINITITYSKIGDAIVTGVLFLFCVINFSRGGISTAALCTVLGMIVWLIYSKSDKKGVFIFSISFLLVMIFGLFIYFDNLTGQTLSKRYVGTVQEKGEENENFGSGLSGREDIIEHEVELFKMYPFLGVGPGMAPMIRDRLFNDDRPSHTEFTRLLSEHGLLGILAMIFLIVFPIAIFRSAKSFYSRLFIIMFATYSIATTFHSAMRLGLVGFSYGIAFALITKKQKEEFNPLIEYHEKSAMWEEYEHGTYNNQLSEH